MNYNFDEVIDRRGTCSEKVDGMVNVWGKSEYFDEAVKDFVSDSNFDTWYEATKAELEKLVK